MMGSNTTQGMNVCLHCFCVCISLLSWRADPKSKESYQMPTNKIKKTKTQATTGTSNIDRQANYEELKYVF